MLGSLNAIGQKPLKCNAYFNTLVENKCAHPCASNEWKFHHEGWHFYFYLFVQFCWGVSLHSTNWNSFQGCNNDCHIVSSLTCMYCQQLLQKRIVTCKNSGGSRNFKTWGNSTILGDYFDAPSQLYPQAMCLKIV